MLGKWFTASERRGIAFVAPGLLVTTLLILYPILSVLYYSFVNEGSAFVGLDNYSSVFRSPLFGKMLGNTAIWTVGTVALAFAIGTGAALLLNQDFVRGRNLWRTVLMLSWITPGVVKAVVWKWLYSYDFGMLNHMLMSLHLIREPVSWLSSTSLALPSVMLVQVWETFPYAMLMMSAGLQAISKDLYEVADLEGASGTQRLRLITLPLLKDVIFIALLILIIWSLNGFTLIWIMTQGGPAGSTEVLALSIYDRFRDFDIHGASAISVLQLLISLVFAIWYIRRSAKEV
ncbi:carbohydrate ABC transporter permease [Cohnella hongkongensis]|uniref:Carbohydrate ABC transporter permease n=1 Tax=Cohnella hongkongensis TaxID=178337 RepID=A0ABV9FEZ3_9BACL